MGALPYLLFVRHARVAGLAYDQVSRKTANGIGYFRITKSATPAAAQGTSCRCRLRRVARRLGGIH